MAVQKKASFKKENADFDGIASDPKVIEAIMRNPQVPLVTITVWEITDINRSILDGTQTPKIRARNIEVMTDDADVIAARKLLDGRYHERTNRDAPPETLFEGPSDQGEPDAVTTDTASSNARGGKTK